MTSTEDVTTVVFNTDVESFDKNPLHIKSEFGDVLSICRGDALDELATANKMIEKLKLEIELLQDALAERDGDYD